MDGMEIFAIIFLVLSVVLVFAAGLDLLGEKARKAMWDELVEKLLKFLTKNTKE